MDAVRADGEREVYVVVQDERNAGFAAECGERFGQRDLEALLAGLVAELDEASAAFERLLRDIEWVAVTAGGGVDDDVQAAEALAQSRAQEPESRLPADLRVGRFLCRAREAGRTSSVST